jgi:rRNA biogenesis protein RRP5
VSVHQPIVCTVIEKPDESAGNNPTKPGKKQHKTLKLSMRASLIQRGTFYKHLSAGMFVWGCVSSVEDHGYVISSGVGDAVCFLPRKHASAESNTSTLCVGAPIACVVEDLSDATKTVTLTNRHTSLTDAITRGSNNLAFKCMQPGMLVHATIEQILDSGLIVNYLQHFHAVIDPSSLPVFANTQTWQSCFHVGDVVMARVVYVDHAGKACRLSMRPHVIEFRRQANLIPLGEFRVCVCVCVGGCVCLYVCPMCVPVCFVQFLIKCVCSQAPLLKPLSR